MKKYLLVFGALLISFIFAQNSFGQIQSVKITPKKVIYKRMGADLPDTKKTFEVNYPEISGVKNPAVLKRLNDTISYWNNFETTLEENTSGDYDWLSSMDYKVNYNNKGLLDIALIMEGVGAYPDQSVKNMVVDLNTGKQLKIADVFTNLPKLILLLDKARKAEMTKAIADLRKESPEDAKALQDTLREYKNEVKMLDEYSIDNIGVTFIYDYGFPHVIQALQPEGRYKYSWRQMKSYIKPGGSLAKFVN